MTPGRDAVFFSGALTKPSSPFKLNTARWVRGLPPPKLALACRQATGAAAQRHVFATVSNEGFAGVGKVARFPLVAGTGHRCHRQ